MKLLFAIKTLGHAGGAGGAERVLAEVTAALSARGHDVTVVSFDREDETDFYVFDTVKRARIGGGSATAPTGPADTVVRMRRLRELARELRPDVAIGFLNSVYIPMAVALAGTGIPVIASEHTVYGHYRGRALERLLMGFFHRRFSAITAISDNVRLSFPPAIRCRMAVVPNPVMRPDHLADPVGGESKTLLSVGRLHRVKDHGTLIAAFARVAGRFPEWTLRIVGEGDLRKDLEAQVNRLGLAGRVELPGRTDDISSEYRSAQLHAITSHYESFGLATAEALAHGVPAIGFAQCPGTNELIEDGRNGILVSGAEREAALAGTLERLMASPELRARLAKEGPATMERFSLDSVVDRWESILRKVAGDRLM